MKSLRHCVAPVFAALLGLALAFAVLPQAGPPAYAAPNLARTVITPTAITSNGVTQTLTAANADGNNFNNNGATLVVIANGYTGTITATFQTPRTIDGLAVADKEVAVPAGETYLIGPFGSNTFNQSDGTVYVDYTESTSVTVGAFYLR
jgi:hypothetical protein